MYMCMCVCVCVLNAAYNYVFDYATHSSIFVCEFCAI